MYKELLMDHYRNPRNRGDVSAADIVRRGSNPRCGDDLEVGVTYQGDLLKDVRFRGRGCSVCIASASLMTEEVMGKTRAQAHKLYEEMERWFNSGEGESVPEPPQSLLALSAVRQYPARRRCVLLAWEALRDALESDGDKGGPA
jgi:nitrogen fixation NifU-like protein